MGLEDPTAFRPSIGPFSLLLIMPVGGRTALRKVNVTLTISSPVIEPSGRTDCTIEKKKE